MTPALKPQDIVLLLKLCVIKDEKWQQADVAVPLYISSAEVSKSLRRCVYARLLDNTRREVNKKALLELLLHGIRYVFPARPGPKVRGLPTAHSALPLNMELLTDETIYVWESGTGNLLGEQIEPLYPTVPLAAVEDSNLYELLALVDAVRVGSTREKTLAAEFLTRLLK